MLLVEDNDFNQLVAEDTLKGLLPGIRIAIAGNGAAAIEMLEQNNYDLVLMDIQMPVMNGVEATKYIRRNMPPGKKEISIIAMTANVLQDDVLAYLAAGMDGYISKPFQTDELLLKMNSVLDRNHPVEMPQAQGVQETEKPVILPEQVTDMNFLDQFTKGSEEKKHKYIGMFLENGPRLLQTIKAALTEKDYEKLKVAAHSMKPQLSYMGVKEEVSNIFLIEQTAGETAHRDQLPSLVAQLELLCHKAFEELRQGISRGL